MDNITKLVNALKEANIALRYAKQEVALLRRNCLEMAISEGYYELIQLNMSKIAAMPIEEE